MNKQFNLVKQLADMHNKAIDKHIKQVTFDLSKKPRQTSNKNK
tara:strand:+ start:260 stop:388 length:129 start_codon:yes stop_codon:yes gene_type:complete